MGLNAGRGRTFTKLLNQLLLEVAGVSCSMMIESLRNIWLALLNNLPDWLRRFCLMASPMAFSTKSRPQTRKSCPHFLIMLASPVLQMEAAGKSKLQYLCSTLSSNEGKSGPTARSLGWRYRIIRPAIHAVPPVWMRRFRICPLSHGPRY